MTERILTLEELRKRTVDELLHQVASEREALTVVLGDGGRVVIQPAPSVKPLPELEALCPRAGRMLSMANEWVPFDASVFIAALLPGDLRHAEARVLVEAARRGEHLASLPAAFSAKSKGR